MLALLLTPHNPDIAFWVLVPFFMLDAAQNAGILIANNGFMIKHSPTENRTMYIAATQALAGIVGGVTSIGAGWIMTRLSGQTWQIAGWTLGHFQMMFAASIVLRWLALLLVQSVREPNSHPTMTLVVDVVESISWRGMFLSAGLPQDEVVAPEKPQPSTEQPEIPAPKLVRPGRRRRPVGDRR
jgi:hypothetical protein